MQPHRCASENSSLSSNHKVTFPCAKKPGDENDPDGAKAKKASAKSKTFLPSYLGDKEIMARVISNDYGRQWLAEREAWHLQHSTSDDHLRDRMMSRCQDTEARYVMEQRCARQLKDDIGRGRLAGSKKRYAHIRGALNTWWKPYPPTKGWRC